MTPDRPLPRRAATAEGSARALVARPGLLAALGLAAGALLLAAADTRRRSLRASRAHPPLGRLLEVEGVRLHVVERGAGSPVVLLHGNGGLAQDFLLSGIVEAAARRHRVIVIERPGYGHSSRPRARAWAPAAQADLFAAALRRLGAARATVLGHSWAAAVAVAMADRHPDVTGGLVLEAGYFYPTFRLDVAAMSVAAVPIVGDLLRHTVLPPLGRAVWPLLMRRIFGPAPQPDRFRAFPRDLALRPRHLRASAVETALMVPCAVATRRRAERLRLPVALVAGEGDRMVSPRAQTERLARALPQARLVLVPGAGHMVHHTAPGAVLQAIEAVTAKVEHRGAPGR